MMGDSGSDEFESDFSGLEIESGDAFDADDELDLSADFDAAGDAGDDEELLIAADANGMSTKLDLARAYHDMGDDDGARQILDEVVAEGSDELKAEAQTLLDSIG
jgi:pilus assembly protein FimV